MKLTITKDGRCFFDGNELTQVTNVDVMKINPIDTTEVVVHVMVDEVDIQYGHLEDEPENRQAEIASMGGENQRKEEA